MAKNNDDLIDSKNEYKQIPTPFIKKLETFNEITARMVKIQTEKFDKYKDGWKSCDLQHLRTKLVRMTTELFIPHTSERQLRNLIHIFNYTFFLYSRIKDGEK